MKQLVTPAIILQRTDYGEADRILTLLTPTYGKLSLLAKGVRRIKSKLAGGIELFSVSEITFIKGRGEVGTLVSTRLLTYYGGIVGNLDRTMLGYELIKQLHKATEDEPEDAYFNLLHEAFAALDDPALPIAIVRLWFSAALLRLAGHSPNLQTDTEGQKLSADKKYRFDSEQMTFALDPAHAPFSAAHIKFLRLVFNGYAAPALAKVQGGEALTTKCLPLVEAMRMTYIRHI